MFDSLHVKCPKCSNELEFQSKSGECMLSDYTKKDLTPMVAIGMDGNIVRCQFCNNRIQLVVQMPTKVKFKLVNKGNKIKFDYNGNYNPKHPESIKRAKELRRLLSKDKEGVKNG